MSILESNIRAESKNGDKENGGNGFNAYNDKDPESDWKKYVEKQGGVWKLK
ncbi:hypothetical protein FACS1894192_12050 [Bacilli bacterium]|nr:hypothetical protein FACS1894192_12050 [Bacilli bacterium]